jgi:uncharacterized repeat protein (TIGR02059 family)
MSMTLTYNEALSSVTAPASAFAVVSGGTARTVTSVATDGAKVILYFASPLSQSATTTVSYTAPAIVIGTANSAIQDIAGNDAISLPLQSVVNNSTVDAAGPTYTAGTAVLDSTGLRITLTYNEALNAQTADPSAFTVTSGVSTRSVTDVTVSGSTVTLTLASPIAAGASATVSYAAPTSSSLTSNLAVQDVAGNDGVSLNSIAIINNSTINFARKNYANDIDGKIKLVGNSVKSKKMSVYIEEFLGKGIRMLLDGDGHSFINFYYEYVDKIYNFQIPLVKIATKAIA